MSLGARATKGGAKVAKEGKQQDKSKGTEKQPVKEKIKPQATTEQLRMAHMIDRKSDDASDVHRMVRELMEMTCRTEEEVCSALHDSDNDMVAACNLLLEESQRIQGEWQTNEKKKKKPPAAASNGEVEPPPAPRSRSGPRPRRGEGEIVGRGRGAGRGRGRGGGAGRGRGGRRSAPARPRPDAQSDHWMPQDNGTVSGDSFPATEDWDNEEWSGSLSDTKVFTPSTNAQNAAGDSEPGLSQANNSTEDWDAMPDTNNGHADAAHIPTYTYHNTNHTHTPHTLLEQPPVAAKSEPAPAQPPNVPMESFVSSHQHQPIGMSGSLTAAQSQYLTQLTQQSQRHDNSVYTSNYGVYGAADMSSQQRKPQRARVPPPSKIPSTAVEMPGGADGAGGAFLDVQFGALEPDALVDAPAQPPAPPTSQQQAKQVTSQNEIQPPSSHENSNDSNAYPNSTSILNDSLSVVESAPSSQSVVSDTNANSASSLEKQISASMKQLNVGVSDASSVGGAGVGVGGGVPASSAPSAASVAAAAAAAAHAQQPQYAQPHHRPKTVGQQSVYATHHAVSHHPVYSPNVYAPQVNSTNASLTGASAMTGTAYPPSVTLSQYHTPNINSYQTSSSASVYGGSALYTAAPYNAYQPAHQPKLQNKDTQYDNSVASSNSLTNNTSTTQTAAAKATATTVSSGGSGAAGAGGAAYVAAAAAAAAPAAFYAAQQPAAGQYAAYDEAQLMRGTLPHHMGTYYDMGYGVGAAREGTFGLGSGERFGRADAASPQQVAAAALPPVYAYSFYQHPPTTYQYGVYPTAYGGGGSNVTGVSGVSANATGKVSTYTQQQPPYDAHDSYKAAGGPYTGSGSKAGAGAAAADLTNTMYAKAHLNKVNSYEKATFPGTPPPFGAASHHQLYIQAPHPTAQHHHPHHHQPQHQMDVRVNSSHNRRGESGGVAGVGGVARGGGGGAGAGAGGAKAAGSKPAYSQSYWAPTN